MWSILKLQLFLVFMGLGHFGSFILLVTSRSFHESIASFPFWMTMFNMVAACFYWALAAVYSQLKSLERR
jgi:hypothetical protein